MGDTGSMIVGYIIGILTLKFISMDESQFQMIQIQPKNVVWLVASILFIPTFDMIRVIIIRFVNKRHIFSPDRIHLHHFLLSLGWSHKMTSIVLTFYNACIFILFFLASLYNSELSLFPLFFLIVILTASIIFYFNKKLAQI